MSANTACDVCGAIAPERRGITINSEDWFHLDGYYSDEDWDLCSMVCLEIVVARIVGLPEEMRPVLEPPKPKAAAAKRPRTTGRSKTA